MVSIIDMSIKKNYRRYMWGSKTWAHVMGLGTTFPQQYVRGEEIIGKPRN